MRLCSKSYDKIRNGAPVGTRASAGVGMGLNPPQYLKHGDKVRIEIAQLGAIENTFIASS